MIRRVIKIVFVFTSIILATFGCNKKESESKPANEPYVIPCLDIQEPATYFPAYPGSWWNYRCPQGELTQFSISDGSCEYCDCAYAKFINLNIGVNGDLFVTGAYHGLGSVSVSYSKIYSLNKDSIFPCPVAFAAMQVNHVYTTIESVSARRVTTIIDTTITLQNSNTFSDVLVVKEYNQYNSSYHYLDYFAKNVGLIRRDSINQTDTVLLLSLEGYFIEH